MDTVMVNTFVVAATVGSISAAARKLRYSESTVAYHVREIEKACRAQLFERNIRGFNLTRDGRVALAISEKLLHTASELQTLPPRHAHTSPAGARATHRASVAQPTRLSPVAPRQRPD